MTKKTEETLRLYNKLADDEKYDFFKALDNHGNLESYSIGMQIDEFIRDYEEFEEDEE